MKIGNLFPIYVVSISSLVRTFFHLGSLRNYSVFCKGLAVMQDGSSIYRILKYVCDPATKQCLCGRHVLVDTYPSKSKRIRLFVIPTFPRRNCQAVTGIPYHTRNFFIKITIRITEGGIGGVYRFFSDHFLS